MRHPARDYFFFPDYFSTREWSRPGDALGDFLSENNTHLCHFWNSSVNGGRIYIMKIETWKICRWLYLEDADTQCWNGSKQENLETSVVRIFAWMTADHTKNIPLCAPRSSCWCRNSWICARGIFRPIYLRGYSFCRANSGHALNTDVRKCNQCDTYHPSIDCKMSASRNGSCLYDGGSRTVTSWISDSQKSDETPTAPHIFWNCLNVYYTAWVFL